MAIKQVTDGKGMEAMAVLFPRALERQVADIYIKAMAELYCMAECSVVQIGGESFSAEHILGVYTGEMDGKGVDAWILRSAVLIWIQQTAEKGVSSPRKYARAILYSLVCEREAKELQAEIDREAWKREERIEKVIGRR